jgi:ribonuclease T2
MKQLFTAIWITMLSVGSALAGGKAGEFDYYVMALSWSPNFCALEGTQRNHEQCTKDADYGWVLHGLWPQYERGYPSHCNTVERNPSRSMTAEMADIMGSAGSAWHQWDKHGRCVGVSAAEYYSQSRFAYDSITRPAVLRKLDKTVKLPAKVIEDAFLQANPGMTRDMITITCRDGHIQEARICLTKGLTPRACGPDVIRDCRLKDAVLEPVE